LVTFGPFTAWQVRKYLKKGGISVSMIAAMGHDNSSLWKPRLGALMLNQYTTHVGALCQLETVRLQKLGVAVEKIELIHNWLDLGRLAYQAERLSHLPRQAFLTGLGLASNRKLVVCLASFQPRKCQSLLITVFAKLASLYTEFDLVLGGKGEELPRCKALAMKLGMETRVHFLGQLVNDDAMSLLSVSDAVVHCSNAETFGYSMVEPLYFEKPTLVTNVGIGYEMKRADIAEVVNPDDEVDLLNGLSRLLAGGAKINDRVSRSRKFVTDNFEVSKIARQVIGLVRHD
jgi:glycosyltransferase involved in cell wall biosynthesis